MAMQMNGTTKASLALEALKKSRPITALSDVYNISRQFIHKQKNKAVDSINKVFSDAEDRTKEAVNNYAQHYIQSIKTIFFF